MVEICTTNTSLRLRYAAEQFFAPIQVRWCTQFEDLIHPDRAVFYQFPSERGLQICASSRNWTEIGFCYRAQPQEWKGDLLSNSLNYDIFEIVFYLLARVDEYLFTEYDEHGRIKSADFIQYQWEGLNCAYIDHLRSIWIKRLGIQDIFKSTHELTIDIDSAYAFLHKGIKRTSGGIAKDIVKGDFRNLLERVQTLLHLKEDRFDTYSYILSQANTHDWPCRFFFLLADFGGQNIGLPYQSKGLKRLITRLEKEATVGIHPGYHEWSSAKNLTSAEIQRLSEIVDSPVLHSRQHFLRMHMPSTYRNLETLDIQRDYTMGMADEVGYRAGTSRAFRWYDYQQDRISSLEVVPFWGMDSAMKRYKNWSADQAKEEIAKAKRQIGGVGDWRMVWHNETVCDEREWRGWRSVFEEQFK